METRSIEVAKDFSRFPAGRYRSDGPWSGEQFREEHLVPALRDPNTHVLVMLDGALGYGSSFLEEVFGGLVRINGFKAKDLHSRLRITSNTDSTLADEAWSYIDDAVTSLRSS